VAITRMDAGYFDRRYVKISHIMPYKDPEERRQHVRSRRANDPAWNEKMKEYFREYYLKTRERRLQKQKERNANNPLYKKRAAAATAKYRNTHRELRSVWSTWHREYNKVYFKRLKKKVFDAYGNKCACCNENTYEFLSVDHINGGGRQHSRKRGRNGILTDIIKEGFPKDKYRLLCMNCNWARSVYGKCPHDK
jgi:hypothetical protein